MGMSRRLCALLCCVMLLLTLSIPVHAAEDDSVREIVQQMLNYYNHHQTTAKADIYRLLQQIKTIDPEQAALWQSIFEYWFYATDDMPKNETEAPDGLPQDDSLCIVVLGYRLDTYGGMYRELVGRLEVALAAAKKYPNAWIVCTGGGTAQKAPKLTEAGQMADWLREQGIDNSRIIVEDDSTHTIHNAQYTIRILADRYPQVRQILLISSDYHLTRSSTLFHAKAMHTAQENGTDPITIAACLGYDAGHEGVAEDPLDQTAHLARVCGFEYRRDDEPALSNPTGITVECSPVLEVGEELDLTVTAQYDTGFSRDVTAECDISPFDPGLDADQMLTVTYSERGSQFQSSLEVQRPPRSTQPPTETVSEQTETPTEAPTEAPVAKKNALSTQLSAVWIGGAAVIALLLLLLLRKKKK